jgi:hypothetical protein
VTEPDAKTALAELYTDLQECQLHLRGEPRETVKDLTSGRERAAEAVKRALERVESFYLKGKKK